MERDEGGGDLNFPQEKAKTTTAAMDFPSAKKLARQLDFNSIGGGAPAAAAAPVVALVQQPPPPPPKMPPPQPPPLVQIPHQHQSIKPLKAESPLAQPRQIVDVKDGTPKKQKQCNCKHSRCLKLYCECFASGIYCDGCNCVNCHNNVENDAARRDAVETTLERNPNAFRPKIASSPHANRHNREEAGEAVVLAKHNKGCHCKKSGCLKKYCECFQANILCSENCKCIDCKNFEGSEERRALFHHGGGANTTTAYLQQAAANAAITGAIGSSGYGSPPLSKKRKSHEIFFGGPISKVQQANHVKTSAPSSSLAPGPTTRAANVPPVGPSKFTYRSLLADLIRPDDIKELCSVLVVYASQATRVLEDEKNAQDKMNDDQREDFKARIPTEPDKSVSVESLGGARARNPSPSESGSDGSGPSKGRPMSPGTLALMCDEHDTVFAMSASNGSGLDTSASNGPGPGPDGLETTEAYAAQERTVLTSFRDCLNRLITFGELKETQCSSLARTDPVGQSQTGEGQRKSQQEPAANGPFRRENGELRLKPEKEL